MEITNKMLTEEGVLLIMSDPTTTVEAVYIANADKLMNKCNCKKLVNISEVIDFTQDSYKVMAHVPSNASTLIFITIKYRTDEDQTIQYITVPFVNEFSLFKAKTKYLELYFGCEECCDHHDHCLGKCCGASCCIGNGGHAHGCCQKGHCCGGCCGNPGEPSCGTYGPYCRDCEDKNRLHELLTFMLRMNIFEQFYKSDNVQGMLKAYKDLCRVRDLNSIAFSYFNLQPSYYRNPGKLQEMFVKLNEELKANSNACINKAIKMLMIQDMYSLVFAMGELKDSPEWILEDHMWNMNDEYWINSKIWN